MKQSQTIYALTAVLLLASASHAADSPASRPVEIAPDNPCVQTITFKVPGKSPDAVSHAIVVVPHAYLTEQNKHWPVLYLLHGHGGDYRGFWITYHDTPKRLDLMADRYGLILVCADGNRTSWYLDAQAEVPDHEDWQYETIISKHLIPEIDRHYRTWPEPAGRGITGISMGGHGSLYLAARHPELFGACSSISGLINTPDTLNPGELALRLGPLEQNRSRWIEHSALKQAEKFEGKKTAILFECGWDDPFINSNRALHLKLLNMHIPHDFFERPGAHTGPYFSNAISYHYQFMMDHLKAASAGGP